MNYIAVDTSGKHLTLIAKKNGQIFSYFEENCGVQHSVRLMPELENLLNKADMKLSEADFFACAVGAGSFTGIRIGVATVKALAFAQKKPVLKITSFDTLAYNIVSGKKGGKILAVIDAKHGGYYACAYSGGVRGEAAFLSEKEITGYINGGYRVISGEPLSGIAAETVSVKDGFIAAIEQNADKISEDVNSLTPLYVRKSQAEEGR